MNPYFPPNNTAGNPPMNSPMNAGVRPPLGATNPNGVPVRPRMQVIPSDRINSGSNQQNYQRPQLQSEMYRNHLQNLQTQHPQQQQNNMLQGHPQQQMNVQQNNVPQSHQSQQQINIQRNNSQPQSYTPQSHPQQQYNQEKPGVLLKQDSAKLQINPTNKPNVPNQYNQSGGVPPETQRTQMAPPIRFPDPRQSMRPPLSNQNSETFLQANQPPNYRQMEVPRVPNDRTQPNHYNGNFQSYKTQLPEDNHAKKSSQMDASSFNEMNSHLKSQVDVQPGNTSNAPKADNERKPDLMNSQVKLSSSENKSNQNNLKSDFSEGKNFSETRTNNETNERSDVKTKEKSQKIFDENRKKESSISGGMVRKNIKFFEENDTAKKPLTPTEATVKRKERDTTMPCNVVKSEFCRDDYESGVDETPVVHPNLRNIFQAPKKVAKIPRLTQRKRSRKNKLEKDKSSLSSNLCHHSYGGKKTRNKKNFGPNEELLAFFEKSKSWRKFNRYDNSAASQNTKKDKLEYKPTTNGVISPKKTPSKLPAPTKVNPAQSPTKSPLKSPGTPGAKSLPKTPEGSAPATPLIKKVPMNKIQVGAAPSPNLKTVRSKVGSLANTTHKPGGGNVKIESHKIDLSKAQPRIEAKNDQYKPSGGDKKIAQVKLQWSAKSKIGSLENATYRPGGGDKKIESVKLDFKEKAKPKVGSKDNVKHVPGGGNIKIENQKLEFKAQSKVGSLDNVKHKPGGGDIKIFDDKTYLRQVSGTSEGRASGTQSYRNSLTENEVNGRSAPATPGRKTTVKVKKIIAFQSSDENPKVEKVTEVTVTSQTLKNKEDNSNSSLKQEVKVTYSKISSPNDEDIGNPVELVKVPAKNYAPILRPSLSKKEVFTDYESEGNKNFTSY